MSWHSMPQDALGAPVGEVSIDYRALVPVGSEIRAEAAPSVRLSGCVPQELTLTIEELRRLPQRLIGPLEIVCMTGRYIEHAESFRGVALVDALKLTGLPILPREILKESVIIAHGHDGYRAIFSWSELHNTAVGAEVLIVHEKNGCALDGRFGPLSLVSAADHRLGPRLVRQLSGIEVIRLPA